MTRDEAKRNIEDEQCDECIYVASMQYLINSAEIWSLDKKYRDRASAMIDAEVCTAPEWAEGSIQ